MLPGVVRFIRSSSSVIRSDRLYSPTDTHIKLLFISCIVVCVPPPIISKKKMYNMSLQIEKVNLNTQRTLHKK